MKVVKFVSVLVKYFMRVFALFVFVLGMMWAFGFISAVIDGGSNPGNPITLAELRFRQNFGSRNSISQHGYRTYVNIVVETIK